MDIRSLFSQTISVQQAAEPAEKGEAVPAGRPKQVTKRESVFVTEKSIATFPVASGLITGIWAIIEKSIGLQHNIAIGAAIAALFGVFLFFMNETDPQRAGDSRRFVRIAVAIANTFVLFGAASGFYNFGH